MSIGKHITLKKAVLLLAVLCALLLAACSAAAENEIRVTLDKTEYKVGDTVSISYAVNLDAERFLSGGMTIFGCAAHTDEKILKRIQINAVSDTVSYLIGENDGIGLRIYVYGYDTDSNYYYREVNVNISDGKEPANPGISIQADRERAAVGDTITYTYSFSDVTVDVSEVYYAISFQYYGYGWSDVWIRLEKPSGTIECGPAGKDFSAFKLKVVTADGWSFVSDTLYIYVEAAETEVQRIPVNAGVWVGTSGYWELQDEDGQPIESMKGIECLEIPDEVTQLSDRLFAYTTKDFYIKCTPGSAGEKAALRLGLQYDNGEKQVIGKNITSVSEKVNWIVSNYVTSGMSDREKARVLHNWICYNSEYDYTYTNHLAYGVLIEGSGVCQSHSLAYQELLNKAGVENTLLESEEMDHIWNLVRVDGQWYHMDVTWDNKEYRGALYTYYLVSDSSISADHYWYSPVKADQNYVGFVEMPSGTWYYDETGKKHTDWLNVTEYKDSHGHYRSGDDYVFYFDQDGLWQTGIVSADGKTYYLTEYGRMTRDSWERVSGESYRFGSDGAALTGWQELTGRWGDPATYYFHEDGRAAHGLTQVGEKKYLFWTDGELMTSDGWIMASFNSEEYTSYYLNEDYSVAIGWKKIDKKRYYFDQDGQKVTGWLTLKSGTYYLDPYAITNKTVRLEKDGVKKYFVFDKNGRVTGAYDSDTKTTEGGGKYKLSKDRKTAVFTGPEKKTVSKLTIRDTVSICGKTYKVTSVKADACKGLTGLKSVKVGKNVTVIGKNAFNGCTSLSSVSGMSAVTTISEGAFKGCKKLDKITLPSKVKNIGKEAFSGCSKLKEITISTKKLTSKTVGADAFKGTPKKAVFICPKGKKDAYEKLLKGKGAAKGAKFKEAK